MINIAIFKDDFKIVGLIIVTIPFLSELCVIILHTKPATKLYFEVKK